MGTRITSVDTDIQEMIDAGIHVCIGFQEIINSKN